MSAKYAADPEFQKHEALLDNGIDLARLTYPEVRTLRCQMQYIFQDPYSSLNPLMTAATIIGDLLQAAGNAASPALTAGESLRVRGPGIWRTGAV